MLKSAAKSCKIRRKTGEKTGENEGMSGRRMQSRADNARKDAEPKNEKIIQLREGEKIFLSCVF